MWSAAILAGGEARRLGGVDKSGLAVGGRSILSRQLAVLRGLTPNVFIVANDSERYRDAGVPVVRDRIPGAGALGGLYTALEVSPTPQVLVLACDMPFVSAPLLTRLAALGAVADVALPRDAGGRHPLCASWSRHLADRLRARIEAGCLRVLDALDGLDVCELGPDELAELDPGNTVLLNVNTPEDYRKSGR